MGGQQGFLLSFCENYSATTDSDMTGIISITPYRTLDQTSHQTSSVTYQPEHWDKWGTINNHLVNYVIMSEIYHFYDLHHFIYNLLKFLAPLIRNICYFLFELT